MVLNYINTDYDSIQAIDASLKSYYDVSLLTHLTPVLVGLSGYWKLIWPQHPHALMIFL